MLSTEDMLVMFRELATDGLPREHVALLASSDRGGAAVAIKQVLSELARNRRPTANEACKVMDVAWEIFGIDNCLNVIFPCASQESFTTFIVDQLRRVPDQFREEHFEILEAPTSAQLVRSEVRLARIASIKREAQRLLVNPSELTNDMNAVKYFASRYSFPPAMNALLDKVQGEFNKGDGFDQAAMMRHLRTFFEKLHEHAAIVLHAQKPETKDGTDLAKCQHVIDYLERKNVLTKKAQALGRSLYGILSEEGVHALESTREYVRLCRNMVAEYGLILFYELERRLAD